MRKYRQWLPLFIRGTFLSIETAPLFAEPVHAESPMQRVSSIRNIFEIFPKGSNSSEESKFVVNVDY
jgi:hypothetical protein